MAKEGVLSLLCLKSDEMELLLTYLTASKKVSDFEFLHNFLGDDLLRFFDTFSGTYIKIPSRDEILKTLQHLKIYNYCKVRGFSKSSVEAASKIFDRKINVIERIIERVQKTLDGERSPENGCESASPSESDGPCE